MVSWYPQYKLHEKVIAVSYENEADESGNTNESLQTGKTGPFKALEDRWTKLVQCSVKLVWTAGALRSFLIHHVLIPDPLDPPRAKIFKR